MEWTPPSGEILEDDPFGAGSEGPLDGSPLADDFKRSMRRLAGAVCAVTAEHDGSLVGITASSVTSLSMTPPSLLVSIRRTSSLAAPLLAARLFTVHVLGSDQEHAAQALAGRFGATGRDAMVEWSVDGNKRRLLAGALVHVHCKVGQIVPLYSHFVVVGLVEAVVLGRDTCPLVYYDGGFFDLCARTTEPGGPR